MLVEKAVKRADMDMTRHPRKSMFLRPTVESASVARRSPPIRQPTKKDDSGRPVMKVPAHSRPQSEMMEVCLGKSQVHESLGSWQILLMELQEE